MLSLVRTTKGLTVLLMGAMAASLAGCATSGGGQGLTASGATCQSLKQQINRIAAKGLPPSNKADADTYNKLLNDYLGSRCHESKT